MLGIILSLLGLCVIEDELPRGPVVIPKEWTAASLQQAMDQANSSHWSAGEEFTVALEADAVDAVKLTGSLSGFELQRVADSSLWTVTLSIEALDQAVFGYDFARYRDETNLDPSAWAGRQFRGPSAPPAPEQSSDLEGKVTTEMLDSSPLGEERGVDVYLPPNWTLENEYPVVYLADGQSVANYAALLEPKIIAQQLEPWILVGIHSATTSQKRVQEYVDPLIFDKDPEIDDPFHLHLEFFVDEVIPWAEETFGVSADRQQRVVFGTSNGGDFSLAVARHHPELFAHVFAFSTGMHDNAPAPDWDVNGEYPHCHLTAGTFETGFWQSTKQWSDTLTKAGFENTFEDYPRGHDYSVWGEEFLMTMLQVFGR